MINKQQETLMHCKSMLNPSRSTWIINSQPNRHVTPPTEAQPMIMWRWANNDRSSSCSAAPLYNNAEENSAELSQKKRPEAFCTCFIWHSQVTHTHIRTNTEIHCSSRSWVVSLSLAIIMFCTLTNSPHCGADWSGRWWVFEWYYKLWEQNGLQWVPRSASESMWRLHLRRRDEVSFIWCWWQKKTSKAVWELRYKHLKGSERRMRIVLSVGIQLFRTSVCWQRRTFSSEFVRAAYWDINITRYTCAQYKFGLDNFWSSHSRTSYLVL